MPDQFTSGFFTCIIRIVDISGNGFVWDQEVKPKAFIGLHHLQHFNSSYSSDFEKLEYGTSRCLYSASRYGKLKSSLGLNSSNLTIRVPSSQIDENGISHPDWYRGGGIRSREFHKEGFFVFRIRADLSCSTNAAANVWLYNDPCNDGDPEESITVELRRKTSGKDYAYFYVWKNGGSKKIGEEMSIDSLDTKYHEFIIEWRTDRIVWYHDGVKFAETRNYIPRSDMKIFVDYVIEPYGWWLPNQETNCSVTANYGGPYMYVDLVGY